MRVLHVVPSYFPATRYGGPIRSVHGLCKALVEKGHEVTVFTTSVNGSGDSDVPLNSPVAIDGVEVWYFRSRFLRRMYWAPEMRNVLRDQIKNFEIVHLHSVFLWPTCIAAIEARKVGVPYFIAPRGMLVRDLIRRKSRWLKTAWISLVERKNLEKSAGIHVTAPLEEAELQRFGYRLPTIFCVPNGIELPDESLVRNAPSSLVPAQPYVLFLSRINWKKGLDRLIQAWVDVQDTLLVIAGNDEEDYQQQIAELAVSKGLSERIRFVGPVQGVDKWKLYKHAQVFVLPSYSENFGIVVLEAMAMGCPVVVTHEVGLADVVEAQNCGITVDGSPDSLANAINLLLGSQGMRDEMGRNGQETVGKHFLWDPIASQMEAVYFKAMNKVGVGIQ